MLGEEFSCFIFGGIVENNNSIVCVFLLQNRFDIPKVSVKIFVLVAWDDDTHSDFFFVLADVVFSLEYGTLLVSYFLGKFVGFDVNSDDRSILESLVPLIVSEL